VRFFTAIWMMEINGAKLRGLAGSIADTDQMNEGVAAADRFCVRNHLQRMALTWKRSPEFSFPSGPDDRFQLHAPRFARSGINRDRYSGPTGNKEEDTR